MASYRDERVSRRRGSGPIRGDARPLASRHRRADADAATAPRRSGRCAVYRAPGAVAGARAALGGWPITRLKARLNDASES